MVPDVPPVKPPPLTPGQMPTKGLWNAVFYDGLRAPERVQCLTIKQTVVLQDPKSGRPCGYATRTAGVIYGEYTFDALTALWRARTP